MKPGTPGFVGVRLREAREARGLTAVSLAELIGVSKQAVSLYESGATSPHPDIMGKIAQALRFPAAFFLRPLSQKEDTPVFFRSQSAATKMERSRAERRLDWAVEVLDYLAHYIDLPTCDYPDFHPPADPTQLTESDIEELARRTRRHWGLGDGPISNVVWLLENHGSIVIRTELTAECTDALSKLSERHGRPFFFLGADKGSAVRSRFDCAHELGHIVLHRNVPRPRLALPSIHKLIENQAQYFAGAFLLPPVSFTADVTHPTADGFRALKPKWLVSIGAMIARSGNLGLVSDIQLERLWVGYSRKGWKKREPLDDTLAVEEPRLLRRCFELLLGENAQTRSDVQEVLPHVRDIEEIAGLAHGFLSDEPLPAIQIVQIPTTRRLSRPDRELQQGEVIEFPGGARGTLGS